MLPRLRPMACASRRHMRPLLPRHRRAGRTHNEVCCGRTLRGARPGEVEGEPRRSCLPSRAGTVACRRVGAGRAPGQPKTLRFRALPPPRAIAAGEASAGEPDEPARPAPARKNRPERLALLPPGAAPEAGILLAARGVRAFGDGLVSLVLPAWLLTLGYGPWETGILASATLAGSALLTLGVGLFAHRGSGRALLIVAGATMALTGLGFAVLHGFWPLLVVAFVGTLNPSSGDVSVFLPLEHARLATRVPRARPHARCSRATASSARSARRSARCAPACPTWLARLPGVAELDGAPGGFPPLRRARRLASLLLYRRLPRPRPRRLARRRRRARAVAPHRPRARRAVQPRRLRRRLRRAIAARAVAVRAVRPVAGRDRRALLLGRAAARRCPISPRPIARAHRAREHDGVHAPARPTSASSLVAFAPSLPARRAAARAQRALADGCADPHLLRHGGGHARGARRGGELHGGAAQPGRGR